jgi:hypothetical protein
MMTYNSRDMKKNLLPNDLLTMVGMSMVQKTEQSMVLGRLVTGPSRRHMTFGWGICCRQTGTAEFKLAVHSESTATSLKGESNPKQNHVALLNDRARRVI